MRNISKAAAVCKEERKRVHLIDNYRVKSRKLSSLKSYTGAPSDLVLTFPSVIALPGLCSGPILGLTQTR